MSKKIIYLYTDEEAEMLFESKSIKFAIRSVKCALNKDKDCFKDQIKRFNKNPEKYLMVIKPEELIRIQKYL